MSSFYLNCECPVYAASISVHQYVLQSSRGRGLFMFVCGEGHVGIFLFFYMVLWTLSKVFDGDLPFSIISRSLNLCILSGCELLYFFSLPVQEEYPLIDLCIFDLFICCIVECHLRPILFLFFLEQKIVFDFTSGPWAVYFLILCHQSTVSYWFHLMELALNHIRFLIITFTSFLPQLY